MTDWPVPFKHSLRWKLISNAVVLAVGSFSRFWSKYLTNVKIHNKEEFLKQVYHREEGKPLITISNHDSCVDDPLLFGSLLPLSAFAKAHSPRMRWTLGAREVCFSQPSHSLLFRCGKVLPIDRGHGIYQPCMNEIIEELNKGDWLHIYPEGKINLDKEFIRLKWGVARLIADAQITPVLLPIWHYDFDTVLPNKEPYRLHTNKRVTIACGKPMYFDDLVRKLKEEKKSALEIRLQIINIIQQEFYELKKLGQKLHDEHLGKK